MDYLFEDEKQSIQAFESGLRSSGTECTIIRFSLHGVFFFRDTGDAQHFYRYDNLEEAITSIVPRHTLPCVESKDYAFVERACRYLGGDIHVSFTPDGVEITCRSRSHRHISIYTSLVEALSNLQTVDKLSVVLLPG